MLALAAGCDRELNAEWCSDHRDDQDCINAGLVQVDAPLPCPAQPCTEPGALICDTGRGGICVECIPGGNDNPPGCHCASDDTCHECTVDEDCGTGAICLPDYTCVGASTGRATVAADISACAANMAMTAAAMPERCVTPDAAVPAGAQ